MHGPPSVAINPGSVSFAFDAPLIAPLPGGGVFRVSTGAGDQLGSAVVQVLGSILIVSFADPIGPGDSWQILDPSAVRFADGGYMTPPVAGIF